MFFGPTGFEALAVGKAPVRSRGDSVVEELLDKGADGLFFAPGNAKAIATHMAHFSNNIDKIRTFEDQSRKLAMGFTVDLMRWYAHGYCRIDQLTRRVPGTDTSNLP
jgi:glycosyltransferase involved in cell wall biosynthesis